ncbi:hypothetical protein [Nioella nitratireducens]|nr:hypothetical protein [Nioella nitratireducens]
MPLPPHLAAVILLAPRQRPQPRPLAYSAQIIEFPAYARASHPQG